MPNAACLTTDLVASKKITARSEVQNQVERALQSVNQSHAGLLAVPLGITVGDEWQGLAHDLAGAIEVDFEVRRAVYPNRVRSGIGWGAVATEFRERSALMDGPCFHRSRAAMTLAKKQPGSATLLETGNPGIDNFMNSMNAILAALFDDWTAKQFASVMAYLDHGTEARAADHLGVRQPTLHKSLAGAHGKEYLDALAAQREFLRSNIPSSAGVES